MILRPSISPQATPAKAFGVAPKPHISSFALAAMLLITPIPATSGEKINFDINAFDFSNEDVIWQIWRAMGGNDRKQINLWICKRFGEGIDHLDLIRSMHNEKLKSLYKYGQGNVYSAFNHAFRSEKISSSLTNVFRYLGREYHGRNIYYDKNAATDGAIKGCGRLVRAWEEALDAVDIELGRAPKPKLLTIDTDSTGFHKKLYLFLEKELRENKLSNFESGYVISTESFDYKTSVEIRISLKQAWNGYDLKARPCKTFKVVTRVSGSANDWIGLACREENGAWEIDDNAYKLW